MTCEEFLPWLESGDPKKVSRAQRHAESCAACRDAASMLAEVKQELTRSERLPERLKQAFLNQSAQAPVALPTYVDRKESRMGLWLMALAAGVLITVVSLLVSNGRNRQVVQLAPKADVRRVSPITVHAVDPSQELAVLERDLEELKRRLESTKADLQRLAVVERLDHVLDDYRGLYAVNNN